MDAPGGGEPTSKADRASAARSALAKKRKEEGLSNATREALKKGPPALKAKRERERKLREGGSIPEVDDEAVEEVSRLVHTPYPAAPPKRKRRPATDEGQTNDTTVPQTKKQTEESPHDESGLQSQMPANDREKPIGILGFLKAGMGLDNDGY